MVKGLKFQFHFKALPSKRKKYTRAIRDLRDKNYSNVDYYGERIHNILKENVPKDTNNLSNSIVKLPLSKSKVKVKLQPHVKYWAFQEEGLDEPTWVVVDTKPDLIGWLERHPWVIPKEVYWPELGEVVTMLLIGGPNTRLGKENKFVAHAQKFINDTHELTIGLTAESFRKNIKKIGD